PTTPSASQPVAAGSLLELLRYRNVWLSMLIACFYVAWMVLGWAFMPVYYMNERQFGSTEMGILMSVLGSRLHRRGCTIDSLDPPFEGFTGCCRAFLQSPVACPWPPCW
ncbi:hypothetical protein P3C22_04830, partial [Pseudomonas sp. ER28]|nr:hypothetical protein [Pseudomonas sp. ER28]